jgi:hypothetical protein
MDVHAQRIRNDPRLVNAACASAVNIELLESDDIRLAGGDDFRNTLGGKLCINTEAVANVIREDPRHLFP